jgi:hypothetical protein
MGKSHADLVKFPSRWDENYRLVVSYLTDFNATACEVIQARFYDDQRPDSQALKPRVERKIGSLLLVQKLIRLLALLSVMPFQRNEDFVGREDIISEIGQQLSKHSRLALCGLGGIG